MKDSLETLLKEVNFHLNMKINKINQNWEDLRENLNLQNFPYNETEHLILEEEKLTQKIVSFINQIK